MDAQLHAKLASLGYRGAPEMLRPGSVNINTYVHVITKDDGIGAPTGDMIVRQMNVLNRSYSGTTSKGSGADTPFRFTLKAVDYTANSDWYDWSYPGSDPADDHEAKAALHEGTYQDLMVRRPGRLRVRHPDTG